LTMFKRRVNITFDWYKKKSDALLFNVPLPPSVGFTSIIKNIGAMQNKGIELTIDATPISTRNFTWEINWNFTHNKNELLRLPPGIAPFANGSFFIKPGLDVYRFYLREYAGVDPANGNPLWYLDSSKSTTTTSYGAAQRYTTNRSALPKFYGGLSNTFTYKMISLEADFYYNFGNYVQDTWAFYLADENQPSWGKYALTLNRWQKPGDITNVPKLVYGSTNGSTSASTRWLYKGDYIRLRNITISYTAPSFLVKQLHLSSLRFYIRGTNIWTKTYDKNLTIDPEQNINSQSGLNIIFNKSITGGLSLGF
jgi:hypothetical protein